MRTQCLSVVFLLAALAGGSYTLGQEPAKPLDDLVVKLLERGASPQKTLRLTPKKGDKQSAVMTMKMNQTMVVSGRPVPAPPTPAMQFTIDAAVSDVAENGDITFEYIYPKISVVEEGDVASPTKVMVESMLNSMAGMKGSGVMTSRGFTKSAELEMPENAAAPLKAMVESLKDSMSKLSSPLPEEPIGVGGKWSVAQSIVNNGMTMQQTTIHTLKEIQGDKYLVAVEVTQSAADQEMKTPGLPAGMKVTLKSLESTGKGQMLLSPDELFPATEMKSESKMRMETNIGGQVQPMDMNLTIEMSIAPPATATASETKK